MLHLQQDFFQFEKTTSVLNSIIFTEAMQKQNVKVCNFDINAMLVIASCYTINH